MPGTPSEDLFSEDACRPVFRRSYAAPSPAMHFLRATASRSHNRPEIQDALQPSFETLVADDIADAIAYMVTLPRFVALLYFDRKAKLGATSSPARA